MTASLKVVITCVMKLIFVLLMTITAQQAFCCASFVPDTKNPKSGGTVKHFFKGEGSARTLVIKNETSSNCRMILKPLEILQRSDGRYRYLDYSPSRVLEGSLAPHLDIIDQKNNSLIQTEVVLKPQETISAKILIALDHPNDPRVGTWVAAVKAFFPDYPAQLTLTEIYYSAQWQVPVLSLGDLSYNKDKQQITYTLKGMGQHYSTVQFQLVMIDPLSGTEVSSFTDADGEKHLFTGYIRNYFLPNTHGEKIIQAELNISGFNQSFLNHLKQNGHDVTKITNWILYIRPYHGFDWQGWVKHHYVPIAPKTIQITK